MLPHPVRLQLLVARTAMLAGVLALGAAAWFTRRSNADTILPSETLQALTDVFYGIGTMTLVGLILLRTRLSGASTDQQRAMYLGGYAAAEVVAVLGGAIWFTGGDRTWYIIGLVLMAVSFQILPLRRE